MSNVQLPEPDTHCFDTDTGLDVWSYSKAQLKQYGDERARELLEMAAKACQNLKKDCGEPDSIQASLNRQMMSCADAIRALAKEIK